LCGAGSIQSPAASFWNSALSSPRSAFMSTYKSEGAAIAETWLALAVPEHRLTEQRASWGSKAARAFALLAFI
jgi:hypothetical protein